MSIPLSPSGPGYDSVKSPIPNLAPQKSTPFRVPKSSPTADYSHDIDKPTVKPENSVLVPPKQNQPSNKGPNDCCAYLMYSLLLIAALVSVSALFWTNFNLNGTINQMTAVLIKYCEERKVYAPDLSKECKYFLEYQNE